MVTLWVWDTAFHEKGQLLEVITLDVGQGDAAIVRFPDNRTMLIDGGIQRTYYDKKKRKRVEYDVGERVIAPYLDFHGIRELDMVVLTHVDLDHGGGLGYILQNFKVGHVLGISDMPLDSEDAPPLTCHCHGTEHPVFLSLCRRDRIDINCHAPSFTSHRSQFHEPTGYGQERRFTRDEDYLR